MLAEQDVLHTTMNFNKRQGLIPATDALGPEVAAMNDILTASLRDTLWHRMRNDLTQFAPELAQNELLMCCCCGRFLPRECFDLEHLIPQQALREDPESVRNNPATPKNVRSGNLLLCKKPLLYKGSKLYENGCNSWKGRHYDKPISDILGGRTQAGIASNLPARITSAHIIGGLILGYLAMVAESGYTIALMPSGIVLREQFFNPLKFHRSLDARYQILLAGEPYSGDDALVWSRPFSFKFERGACLVMTRNYVMWVPVSRDPSLPIAQHVKIVPERFKMRPNFNTRFT